MTLPRVLVIAGSDTSGGAGLQRDLTVLDRLGCTHASVVTALTAQNDHCVADMHVPPQKFLGTQLCAALASGPVAAVKIGMLADAPTVRSVAAALEGLGEVPIILDPVLVATSGRTLLDRAGQAELKARLLPLATLVTPNLDECAVLTGKRRASQGLEIEAQARALLEFGSAAVLLKGGHAKGAHSVDLLVRRGEEVRAFSAPRIAGNMRGTGCALASAIAARLAHGDSLERAIESAKHWVHGLISEANEPAPPDPGGA